MAATDAILGELHEQASAVPIAVASLEINLTVVPTTILFLALDPVQGDSGEKNAAAQGGKHLLPRSGGFAVAAATLGETIPEPLVWAPVVAIAVVLSGSQVPLFSSTRCRCSDMRPAVSACSPPASCSPPVRCEQVRR
jgi:malonate transporter and related proteins